MRILIITYQGDISGATNSITYLAKGLASKGHDIFVGCREESLLYKNLLGSKVKVVPMVYKKKLDLSFIKHLKNIVKENNIEIINAQSSWDRYSSVFVRWLYRMKVKVVHTRRQTPMSMGGFFQNLIYEKGTDKIIAVSQGVKKDLMKLGISDKNIEVIYNGTSKEKYDHLDPILIQSLRQKFDIKPDDFVIGCVSRPKKQIQILEALQHIERPIKVIFAGLEKTPELASIIEAFKVPHLVYFEGNISDTLILNYYKLFNVHILASTMEGLSQSLLEAMALEVPVIATAASGNLDLIENNINGLLFKDGDTLELAEKIKLLINDSDLQKRFSKAGKITALDKFSLEKTIQNYETFFSELLAQ